MWRYDNSIIFSHSSNTRVYRHVPLLSVRRPSRPYNTVWRYRPSSSFSTWRFAGVLLMLCSLALSHDERWVHGLCVLVIVFLLSCAGDQRISVGAQTQGVKLGEATQIKRTLIKWWRVGACKFILQSSSGKSYTTISLNIKVLTTHTFVPACRCCTASILFCIGTHTSKCTAHIGEDACRMEKSLQQASLCPFHTGAHFRYGQA